MMRPNLCPTQVSARHAGGGGSGADRAKGPVGLVEPFGTVWALGGGEA